ncbi:hypothetical protein QQF64_018528 [Cirrhinus molitorella]|uniref:Uncharacterized protein n=1 Tax=Cirrhinus molitorella TaxID=172907 RepID=A0ABR3LCW8_9TELE
MQLVDLQADVALKEQFVRTDPSTFWLQVVPETAFPGLRKVALHILTMFGSTYNCEGGSVLKMNIIKTKISVPDSNEHFRRVEGCLDSFKGTRGVVIGILVVVENVMEPLPAFYNGVALVIEEKVLMRQLSDIPIAFLKLMGLVYALNLDCPKELKITFESEYSICLLEMIRLKSQEFIR